MSAARYVQLLRRRPIGLLFAATLVGRLPWGMTNLALILVVTGHGAGYGRAGLVTAAETLGTGLAAPVVGRAVDAFGRRALLPPLAVAQTGMLVGVAAVGGGPFPALLALAAAAGAATPPLAASARSLWPALLDGPLLETMYALEATLQELAFIVGPALVAVLATWASPAVALVTGAGLGGAGAIVFALHPAVATARRAPGATRGDGAEPGLLRRPAVRRLVVVGTLLVFGLNACDVAIVAFAGGRHASGTAGLLYAAWSAGSLVGGVVWGARSGPGARLAPVLALVALHLATLAGAPGRWGLGVLLAVGGTTIAPALARLYSAMGAAVPTDRATEAFSWLATAFVAGGAAGSALGGWSVQLVGPRLAFGVAAVAVLAAAYAASRPQPGALATATGPAADATVSAGTAPGGPPPAGTGPAAPRTPPGHGAAAPGSSAGR